MGHGQWTYILAVCHHILFWKCGTQSKCLDNYFNIHALFSTIIRLEVLEEWMWLCKDFGVDWVMQRDGMEGEHSAFLYQYFRIVWSVFNPWCIFNFIVLFKNCSIFISVGQLNSSIFNNFISFMFIARTKYFKHMISIYINNILHSMQLVLHVKIKGSALAVYELTITLQEIYF